MEPKTLYYSPANGDACLLYDAPKTRDADGSICLKAPDGSGYYRYDLLATLSRYERRYLYTLA